MDIDKKMNSNNGPMPLENERKPREFRSTSWKKKIHGQDIIPKLREYIIFG